jgi:hypothetical protein
VDHPLCPISPPFCDVATMLLFIIIVKIKRRTVLLIKSDLSKAENVRVKRAGKKKKERQTEPYQ